MNDLKIPNDNISECVPSVLCEPNVLCTKKTNLQTNISQNILTKSRCLVKTCNLSESKILENRGQETNSQDSKEKPWSSYSAKYK